MSLTKPVSTISPKNAELTPEAAFKHIKEFNEIVIESDLDVYCEGKHLCIEHFNRLDPLM